MPRSAHVIGTINVDDREVVVLEGDTIGACLMRADVLTHRRSRSGEPRGLYCAIGVCNDCLVSVDGTPNVRACVTKARPGARVQTGGRQE
jgi:predicted molibdopterin-dependent oxidoreductase YjgC